MAKLIYWRSYDRPFSLLFWFLVLLFVLLAGTIIIIQIIGVQNLIPWDVLTTDSSFVTDFKIFNVGPFSFSIPAEKKVLQELYSGGVIPDAIYLTGAMMVAIIVAMLIYLTLVTYFNRLWYLIAMAGFLVFLVLLNIESVALFGWTDYKGLIIVFILLLTPSYYLHAFNSNGSLLKRLWVMGAAFILLLILAYFFGESDYTLRSYFGYGLLAPYILIILFILTVAHELIAAFINIITGTDGIADSTKLRHFLVITLIYLVNILLSYLYVAHYIDWQLIYINPFFLLIVSAILGIWGSRARTSLYAGASGIQALWPILYLLIGVISLGTLTYLMLSVNDPMLKILSDLTVYAHLGIGVAFLLYVLYNFIPLIEKGYKLKEILYNPTNLPYITYRLMGLLIVVGLFAIRGFQYPTWYSLGGYNNANADIEISIGHKNIGEAYFVNGNTYAFHNHKSNYSLGMMLRDSKPSEAINHFEWSLDQMPTAQSIINKANLENRQQELYQALFTLQEGNQLLPGNVHIQNNLARQFEKVKILDSADYYYAQVGPATNQVRNNRLSFAATHGKGFSRDSTDWLENLDRAGLANAAALGYFKSTPEFATFDHMFDMVYMNNWLLMDLPHFNDKILQQTKTAIDSTLNVEYRDQLKYSWSLASFEYGKTAHAIEGLLGLMYSSTEWSERASLALGRMYLSLGAYEQAITILFEASKGEINLDIAVAYLENGKPEKVEEFWQQAAKQEGSFISEIGQQIWNVVYAESPVLEDDQAKYLYARYNRYFIDETEQNQILKSITDRELRINLALDLAEFYHNYNNPAGALLMLKNIEGLDLGLDEHKRFIILHALVDKTDTNVQHQLVEYDSLFGFRNNEYLLENSLNHLAGMELDSIDYVHLATDNPFFTDAVLIGVEFLKSYPDSFDAYSYIARAVQLNPESPRLMREYVLLALETGMDIFAEKGLAEFSQRFGGQAYMMLKEEYDRKVELINQQIEAELNE